MKNKGSLYIRRIRPAVDRAEDMCTAYAMVLFKYGAFRRGYPNLCIMAGQSKHLIKKKFWPRSWKETKAFFKESRHG